MTYRCRTILPTVSAWKNTEGASPEEAAAEFWTRAWERNGGVPGEVYHRTPGNLVAFARVEVEGHGDMVARVFWSGLVRSGGVRRHGPRKTLTEIAKALRWEDAPEELLSEGWQCEETEETARAARR